MYQARDQREMACSSSIIGESLMKGIFAKIEAELRDASKRLQGAFGLRSLEAVVSKHRGYWARIGGSPLNKNFGLNEMKLASWWCCGKGRAGEVSILISFSS